MMNPMSRVLSVPPETGTVSRPRVARAHLRMATLAAIFSLFALYIAWHEARNLQLRRADESPALFADDLAYGCRLQNTGSPTVPIW